MQATARTSSARTAAQPSPDPARPAAPPQLAWTHAAPGGRAASAGASPGCQWAHRHTVRGARRRYGLPVQIQHPLPRHDQVEGAPSAGRRSTRRGPAHSARRRRRGRPGPGRPGRRGGVHGPRRPRPGHVDRRRGQPTSGRCHRAGTCSASAAVPGAPAANQRVSGGSWSGRVRSQGFLGWSRPAASAPVRRCAGAVAPRSASRRASGGRRGRPIGHEDSTGGIGQVWCYPFRGGETRTPNGPVTFRRRTAAQGRPRSSARCRADPLGEHAGPWPGNLVVVCQSGRGPGAAVDAC